MKKLPHAFVILVLCIGCIANGGETSIRGIDFRMQFITGDLQFTSISGINRKFTGKGSELSGNIYFAEYTWFRSIFFISSRIMTWTGQDVAPGENDDLQMFSVGPGLELQTGPLFFRVSNQNINANSYSISTSSVGRQFTMNGNSLTVGLNFKFNHLGIGLSASTMDFTVPGSNLGLSQETMSPYSEKTYSLNFIYYMGIKPSTFFLGLF